MINMEKKRLIFMLGFIFTLALAFLLAKQATSNAAECRIVRIVAFASDQSVMLTPDRTLIKKGDCVVWFNNVVSREFLIVFENGKKCTDVIESSMDFELNEESCLVTKAYIPNRGTASFAFDKEGSFDYVLEAKGTDLKIKGQIIVRE